MPWHGGYRRHPGPWIFNAGGIHRRGPWRSVIAVEDATLTGWTGSVTGVLSNPSAYPPIEGEMWKPNIWLRNEHQSQAAAGAQLAIDRPGRDRVPDRDRAGGGDIRPNGQRRWPDAFKARIVAGNLKPGNDGECRGAVVWASGKPSACMARPGQDWHAGFTCGAGLRLFLCPGSAVRVRGSGLGDALGTRSLMSDRDC